VPSLLGKVYCARGLFGRQGVSRFPDNMKVERMRHTIKASLVLLLLMTGVGGAAAQSSGNQPKASNMETNVNKIK
jgi:hypothetical protein